MIAELKGLSVHVVFVGIHLLSAVLTLIPSAGASKASMLGYRALCSFSPISTAILLGLAALHIVLHLKQMSDAATGSRAVADTDGQTEA